MGNFFFLGFTFIVRDHALGHDFVTEAKCKRACKDDRGETKNDGGGLSNANQKNGGREFLEFLSEEMKELKRVL